MTRVADEVPEYPLGYADGDDGRFGYYDDDSVAFKAVCEAGKGATTSVNAVATADYDHVTFQDRATLIELARDAAYKTADNIGCTPAAPAPSPLIRLYIPDAHLVKATSAETDGTCSVPEAHRPRRHGPAPRPRAPGPGRRAQPQGDLPAGGEPGPGQECLARPRQEGDGLHPAQ
ncbi:hypothetical protein [Streptomyces sp. NBC_00996]|uniref:hypothetical protein n=1 Tax=Streptomyces sp. NBC_00996 TaxID=2903710 RepID=UPI00386A472C|nr:hypothetical protein OG390_00350 [Streptomyces sp. NBC_00996]